MKAIVNHSHQFELNSNPYWDCIKVKDGQFHIIYNSHSYVASVVSHDSVNKVFEIQINNTFYTVELKERFDDLIHQLGFDVSSASKDLHVKALMPGKVLDVLVRVGDHIKEGDNLLILEAMKMEDIIKSSCSGTISAISVSKGDSVEKNALLLTFE